MFVCPPAPPQYAHYTTQLSKGLDICETRPHVVQIHTTANVSEKQGEKAKVKNNMQDGMFFLIVPIYSMEQVNMFFIAFSQDPGKQKN